MTRRAEHLTPYILLLLPVGLVAIALGYPVVRQTIMSFQEFGLAQQFGQPAEWAGVDNYVAILTDRYFWVVTGRSLVFTVACASLTMVIGIALAVLMQRVAAAARIGLQMALIFAWATPVIAAVAIWRIMTDYRHGIVNELLTSLGLNQFQGFHWLQHSTFTFLTIAAIVIVWAAVPLVSLAVYAALTQVDESVLEAAQLDGAGLLRTLWHIVLPIIKPVIVLLTILQVIWDLRAFAQIYSLQQGVGNNRGTNLLGTYIYHTGIGGGDYGMASALAMVMLLILITLTWRYVRILGKQGDLT